MRVDLRLGDLDDAAAVQLIAELNEEIQARYHEPVEGFYFKLDSEAVAPGRGAFALAWVDHEAVGCGAIRLIEDDTAELKRIYVVPQYRRQGVAGAALQFLEAQARSLGASRVVLETVTDPPAATALYSAAGYEEIPKFGPYVKSEISVCMAKVLRSA